MNRQRIVGRIEVALFLAVLASHVAAFCWASLTGETSFARSVVLDSIVVSQAALLAILAVLGPGKWFWRWPFVAICFAGIYLAQSGTRGNYLFPILAYQTTALTAALLMTRGSGFWIEHRPNYRQSAVQFSMRTLLIVTSLSAAGLTVAGVLRSASGDNTDSMRAVGLGGAGFTFAVAAILTLWLVLRPKRLWLGLAALVLLAPGLGLLPAYLLGREDDWWIFSSWTAGYVAIVAATLLLLRLGNWNLVRGTSVFASVADRWIRNKTPEEHTSPATNNAEYAHSANSVH